VIQLFEEYYSHTQYLFPQTNDVVDPGFATRHGIVLDNTFAFDYFQNDVTGFRTVAELIEQEDADYVALLIRNPTRIDRLRDLNVSHEVEKLADHLTESKGYTREKEFQYDKNRILLLCRQEGSAQDAGI